MVKGEFTIDEMELLMIALNDMVNHGGDIIMMESCIKLHNKIEKYNYDSLKENTINV